MDFFGFFFTTLLVTDAFLTVVMANTYVFTKFGPFGNDKKSITKLTSLNGLIYLIQGETLHSFSPITYNQLKVGATPGTHSYWSYLTTFNDEIYVTGNKNGGLYKYNKDSGVSRVAYFEGEWIQGITFLKVKIYLGSRNGNLYEFDPVSNLTNKLNTKNVYGITGVAALSTNNKIYAAPHDAEGLYEIDPISRKFQFISSDDHKVNMVSVINDKIYYGANDSFLRQYDPITKVVSTICTFLDKTVIIAIAEFNKNIYIGAIDSKYLWKVRDRSICEKIPIPDKGDAEALLTINNKLYIGGKNSILYEFDETQKDHGELTVQDLNCIQSYYNEALFYEITHETQLKRIGFFPNMPITKMTSMNDILFISVGENLLSYFPKTGKHFKVGEIPGSGLIWSYSTTLNNEVYVTDFYNGGLYKYNESSGVIKVASLDGKDIRGITFLNDKIYFGIKQGDVYEFDPVSSQTNKLNTEYIGDLTGVAALNITNKLYVGSFGSHGLYEVDPITGAFQLISPDEHKIIVISAINDKLYFGANNSFLRQYDPITKVVSTLCNFSGKLFIRAIAQINKVIYVAGYNSNFLWKVRDKSICEKISVPDNGNAQALLALNNKLYIGSNNSNLYEFQETQKDHGVLTTEDISCIHRYSNEALFNGITHSTAVGANSHMQLKRIGFFPKGKITKLTSMNDLIYFSEDDDLHSFSPQTYKHLKVGEIPGSDSIWSYSTTLNDELYVTGYSNGGLYKYSEDSGVSKVAYFEGEYIQGITFLNDKIYFGTGRGDLYELDPGSNQTKHLINSFYDYVGSITGVAALSINNKVYTGAVHSQGLYEIDPLSRNFQLISSDEHRIHVISAINDKLYFGANGSFLREFDPITNVVSTICMIPHKFTITAIAEFNKIIYFGGTDSKFLWKVRDNSICEKIPVPDNGNAQTLLATNNNLYIGSNNSYLYKLTVQNEYDTFLNIVKNRNSLVTIEVEKPYSDQGLVFFTNRYNFSPKSFMHLLKEGAFLTYANKNNGDNVGTKLVNLSTDNVYLSNVVASRRGPIQKISNFDKAICFDKITMRNYQNQSVQALKPACNYQNKIEITNVMARGLRGISVNESIQSWNNLLGVWPFVKMDSLVSAGNDVFFDDDLIILSHYWDNSIETDTCNEFEAISVDPEIISLPPRSDTTITARQKIEEIRVFFYLKQVIYGRVTVEILNKFNVKDRYTFPLKEIMQNLRRAGALPPQILINDDESIAISGGMVRTLKTASHAMIRINYKTF